MKPNKLISYKKGSGFIKNHCGLTEDIFEAAIEQAMIFDRDIVAYPSQEAPYTYHFNPQIKSLRNYDSL